MVLVKMLTNKCGICGKSRIYISENIIKLSRLGKCLKYWHNHQLFLETLRFACKKYVINSISVPGTYIDSVAAPIGP